MKTLKKITLVSFLIGSMMTMALFTHAQAPLILSTAPDNTHKIVPYISAGEDVSLCNDSEFKTLGTTNMQGTTYWISDGDGTFENPFNLNTLYIPGPHDISNGMVTLILKIAPLAVPAVTIQDEMTLYLNNCLNTNSTEH